MKSLPLYQYLRWNRVSSEEGSKEDLVKYTFFPPNIFKIKDKMLVKFSVAFQNG